MTPRNDWERLIESLLGFVVGNWKEEDHYETSQRLIAAEKFLARIAPDRLKAAKQEVKEYRKEQGI